MGLSKQNRKWTKQNRLKLWHHTTQLYIYKHIQLIFDFITVILVKPWWDTHICFIVKNVYVLLYRSYSSWRETVLRTLFIVASPYSSYTRVSVDPTVVTYCLCSSVFPLKYPWLWSSDRASVPHAATPAAPRSAVGSLAIRGTFIMSRMWFTVCALRSESSK